MREFSHNSRARTQENSGQLGIVGLSMPGGVIPALAAGPAFLRWKRLPLLRYSDLSIPSVALGEGITVNQLFSAGLVLLARAGLVALRGKSTARGAG